MDLANAVPSGAPAPGTGETRPPAVRLLGPVRAVLDAREVALTSPKLRRLFTVLALHRNHVVSAARLVDQLWPDVPPSSATASLQVYVSRLRAGLAAPREGAAGRVRVERRSPGYVLVVREEDVDAGRFVRLADAARRQLSLDADRALLLLDEALGLVAGDPLPDVQDEQDPLAAEAQRLRALVVDAQELRVEALLAAGQAGAAVLAAHDLALAHPLRETAHALHVLALYRSGRPADALEAYEQLRARLGDELGADPGPELRRLHARVLRQDPALDGPRRPPRPAAGPAGLRPEDREAPSSSTLVGRAVELGRMDQALRQLAAGHGGVWTLSGEAGIGKTRLAEELARRALDLGLPVAWGRGEEDAGEAPYRPWRHVLRSLPDPADHEADHAAVDVLLGEGEAAPGPPDPGARVRQHDAVAEALRGRTGSPLVVVLEDVQWFDDRSSELLLAVARTVTSAPLLLALTLREEAAPTEAVRRLSAELVRLPGSHRVRLGGLAPTEAAALLSLAAGLPAGTRAAWFDDTIVRAEGNPLFLVELARLLHGAGAGAGAGSGAALPSGLRDLLLGRLRPLGADARRLLDVAAVAGRQVAYALLQPVLGWPADRLDAALAEVVDAGLVTEELLPGLSVRFGHALVQEVLLAGLRPSVRARWHAAVGRALAAVPGQVDSEAVLAHLTAGADVVPVEVLLEALLDAARRASGQTAYEHAERLLRRALDLAVGLPEGQARDTLELRVQARLGSAIAGQQGWSAPAAEAALTRAYALARRAEPDVETFGALYHQLSWLVVAADFPRASVLAQELLERAQDATGEVAGTYELLARIARGLVAWHRGLDEAAVPEMRRALELAATVVDARLAEVFTHDPTIPLTSLLAHALVGSGRVAEGLAASRQALLEARQTRPPETAAALMAATLLAAARREPERARELAEELLALARTHQLGLYVVLSSIPLGWARTLLATGDADRDAAVAEARQAYAVYARSGAGTFTPLMTTLLAEAELAAGHPDASRETAAAGVAAAERTDVRLWWSRLSALAAPDDGPGPNGSSGSPARATAPG